MMPSNSTAEDSPHSLVSATTRAARGWKKPLLLFLLANMALCLFVFRGGLWGNSLLAPLDILPALDAKFHFMDPNSSGIPANQFIVDQVTYDLPIQHTIYEAYRRGEIPWWDPFTWAGRPLLAEAHINGTDPIRVANYLLLPFEMAYNWTRILHFIFGGLGMLFLLRHWRFPDCTCILLALTYEFAGCQALHFGHPWIQASFNYYPLLWLAWDGWFQKKSWWRIVAASFWVAGSCYSGNLQSHAYLVLFTVAMALGYGARSWKNWLDISAILAASLLLGAAMAMPVLLNEIELYTHSLRTGFLGAEKIQLAGWAALSAIYPWALGTFRTLDLAKLLGASNAGFYLFIGSAGALLAVFATWMPLGRTELAPAKRTALWLVGIYFLIVCTPLSTLLYWRSAGLGMLGLIVLAAVGWEALQVSTVSLKRWAWFTAGFVIVVGMVTNVAGLFIYPKFLPTIREMVFAQNEKTSSGFRKAYKLRDFQINNFANEVSFKNPETVIASLGLMAFAGACFYPAIRRRRWMLPGLLALNFVPVVLFTHRSVPVQPLVLWQRLLADGTEQRRVANIVNAEHGRLEEAGSESFERLYPYSISHLFGVHNVAGYSSLQPKSFALLSPAEHERWLPQTADYIYESPAQAPTGELRKNPTPGSARFQWLKPSARTLKITKESLNEICLSFGAGDEAELLRTDTYYPGWSARIGSAKVAIRRTDPFFSKLRIPPGNQQLVLRYEPVYLRPGIASGGVALGVMGVLSAVVWFKAKNPLTAKTESGS